MKKKILLLSLATLLLSVGVSAQTLPGLTDTVKLKVVANEHWDGILDSTFVIQVLISHDTAYSGGTLGFTWASDSANWKLDSATYGPGLALWELKNINMLQPAKVLVGGAKLFAPDIAAGTDQEWCKLWFSLKTPNTWTTGSEITIDSAFVPPAGPFVVTYTGSRTRQPRFVGGQKVTYNDVRQEGGALPNSFSSTQNYPNPFNPNTKFTYSVPVKTEVTVNVFNVLGQKVRTLVNGPRDAGTYDVEWNGQSDDGRAVASGMYFYKITAGSFVQTRKMLLTK